MKVSRHNRRKIIRTFRDLTTMMKHTGVSVVDLNWECFKKYPFDMVDVLKWEIEQDKKKIAAPADPS